MGKIEFHIDRQSCRFADPTQNFEPVEKITEIRRDPLTGRTSRILDMPVQLEKPDTDAVVKIARSGFNPFAKDKRDQVTPRFLEESENIPGGRLALGEALVVPNLFPYDRYSAVTILSEEDYIPLTDFPESLLIDAFTADLEYLRRARDAEPAGNLIHFSVNWNYLPLAGGSIVHPHHQIIASPAATNYLREIAANLESYEGDYFAELIEAEAGGERWIGRAGDIAWLAGFAPLGQVDIVGIFEGIRSIFDIREKVIGDLAWSLRHIFSYLDARGFGSFNFSLYGLENAEGFTVHCRLSPRFLLSNALGTSDINYFEIMHSESLSFFSPEEEAVRLHEVFHASKGG